MKAEVLFRHALPYRRQLLLAGAMQLLESLVLLSLPWFGGKFAAGVLAGSADREALLLILLVLLLLQVMLRFVNANLAGRTAGHITTDLRIRIYEHLQQLPLPFFQQRRRGDLLALTTYEIEQLATFVSGTLLALLPLLLTVAGAVVLMYTIDPALAVMVGLLVPLFCLVVKILGRRLRPLAERIQQSYADTVAIVDENLDMLPAIKAFNREAAEARRYREQNANLLALNNSHVRIQALLQPMLQFLGGCAVLLLLELAADRIAAASMSTDGVVGLLLYAMLLVRPVSELAGYYGQIQAARGTLTRLQQVLAEPPEANGAAATLPVVHGDIRFENVGFAYPGRQRVLDGVNLHIRAGETVAIVGANGSGKSTLIQLLFRFYHAGSGRILLDDHDINTLDLHFLREQISVVSQRVLLFNGTVAANIGFAREGATPAEIESAAVLAQAHDFISKLPNGYDTLIGDHGVRLSGGQRQRLALARALLKRAPVLVLDEATAMFDPEGEDALLAQCRALLAHTTVILITHRPASLALADRVLCLQDGRLHPLAAAQWQPLLACG